MDPIDIEFTAMNLICRYLDWNDITTLSKINQNLHQQIIKQSQFVTFPQELMEMIINQLSRNDLINLSIVCKSYCDIFMPSLHYKCMQCRHQIEKRWNRLVPFVEQNAHDMVKVYKDRHQSWTQIHTKEDDNIYCKVFLGEVHSIHVEYVYNPRDVHILSWYIDNRRMGWTFL